MIWIGQPIKAGPKPSLRYVIDYPDTNEVLVHHSHRRSWHEQSIWVRQTAEACSRTLPPLLRADNCQLFRGISLDCILPFCLWLYLIHFDSFWFYSLTLRLPLILWLPPCFSKSPRHDMPLQSLQNLLNLLRFDRWFERCSWSRWRLYWSPVRNLVSWDRLYMSPAGQPHFESTTEPELGSQPKCSAWAEKVFLGLVIASLATRPMNPAVRCTVLFLGSRDESWVLTGCWSLHFWQFWNDEVVTLKPCVMTGHPCDSMSRETRVQSSSWPRQWPPAQSCSLSWLGFRFSSRQAPGGLRKNLTTDSNS